MRGTWMDFIGDPEGRLFLGTLAEKYHEPDREPGKNRGVFPHPQPDPFFGTGCGYNRAPSPFYLRNAHVERTHLLVQRRARLFRLIDRLSRDEKAARGKDAVPDDRDL